jgi:hypothetical protein
VGISGDIRAESHNAEGFGWLGRQDQGHESLNVVKHLLRVDIVLRRMLMSSAVEITSIAESAAKGINNDPLIHCLS